MASPQTEAPPLHRWTRPSDRLVTRPLDDELAIFDESSGDTHVLAGINAFLLVRLLQSPTPLSTDELADAAGHEDWEAADPGELTELLQRLADAGLVRPVA